MNALKFRTVIEGSVKLMKNKENDIFLDAQGDIKHPNSIWTRPVHDMDVVEFWEDRLEKHNTPYCLAQFEEGYLIFTKGAEIA